MIWWNQVQGAYVVPSSGTSLSAPPGKMVNLVSFGGYYSGNYLTQVCGVGFYVNDATWSGTVTPSA